jgi:predicted component of type VI protein secretion system
MLQLQVLSGSKAGQSFSFKRYPVRVGRSSAADLSLDEDGVWDSHFEVTFTKEGLLLKTCPNAWVTVNEESVNERLLSNGDVISIGALKLRFGLSAMRQRSLALREWATWAGLAGICLLQVWMIYWLIR